MGKGINKLVKIKLELEKVGLYVEMDDDEKNPTLTVKRKPTSKKVMFELVFEKGKRINLVTRLKDTRVAWIDLT